MRGYHDVGGLPFGAIDRAQHDYALWEKRVDAMLVLLSKKGLIDRRAAPGHRDARRRRLRAAELLRRWIASIARALVDRGVITTDELGRRMADAGQRAQETP
jgi:hypothetical protein